MRVVFDQVVFAPFSNFARIKAVLSAGGGIFASWGNLCGKNTTVCGLPASLIYMQGDVLKSVKISESSPWDMSGDLHLLPPPLSANFVISSSSFLLVRDPFGDPLR
jgi:hypothetical protein